MNPDLRSAFGARVRLLREKRGYSQEAFALRSGLHRTYMGGIERGERNPTLESMSLIAKALDVSLAVLVEGIG